MRAYKLCRLLSDGNITSLFINKKRRLPFGVWLNAESFPTKGYKERPFWHCTSQPNAPHLSEVGRVWVEVEMEGIHPFPRPNNQGGLWYLAERIKIIQIL